MTEQREDQDFAAILAEFEREQEAAGVGKEPQVGEKVSGRVLSIGEETAFVDVGAKSDGVVSLAELRDEKGELTVVVGDEIEALVSGRDEASGCLVLRVRPGAGGGMGMGAAGQSVAMEELAQAQAHGIPVEGTVSEVIKGGVEVTVSGLRAFCPISQLERGYVEDASSYVGRRLSFRVRRFSEGRGGRPDVVLSRRDLLEEEERQRRQETLAHLEPGSVVRGKVTSVTSYGAFVDLGGIEGLLHVSEMAHGRVENPEEHLSPGDVVEVKVLKIEEGRDKRGKRISLSRRALQQDPWQDAAERYPAGTTVTGRVMRLESYGAFVELAPGLEGLIHVSEMATGRRVAHAREVVELGQAVEVRVKSVDTEKRRISLALEAAIRQQAAEAASVEEYLEEHKEATGFGSMADFFQKAKKKEG